MINKIIVKTAIEITGALGVVYALSPAILRAFRISRKPKESETEVEDISETEIEGEGSEEPSDSE